MNTIIDWVKNNLLAAALLGVIMIAAAAVIFPANDGYVWEIEVEQRGPFVQMTWDEEPGAMFYEVQGRLFDQDFETFTIVPEALMRTALPPGVAQFRVRAWTEDGPTVWSEPTEFLFFVPAPAPPETVPDPGAHREDAMFLPWDPALMEPGEFDGPMREC